MSHTGPDLRAAFDRLAELPAAAREAELAAIEADPAFIAELRALLDCLDDAADPIAERVQAARKEAPMPAQIGPYRILDRLGAGGMGQVYLAERTVDGVCQRVALKLVQASLDPRHADLFARERLALARLGHPNIARFLDAGLSAEGQRYLAMEYVEGQSLGAWMQSAQPALDARLQLFEALASAVQHAHAKLIVHRDLKPANVLVTGEGRPMLLDFGIAKLIDPDSDDPQAEVGTQTRAYTPGYAAPEQLAGEAVTTATDVYALGLILFELLCGEPARTGANTATRTRPAAIARSSGQEWLRRDWARTAGDLERIVGMSLREEPERRYPSVQALVEDIGRFRRGLPVSAVPDSTGYRLRRFAGRHRIGMAMSAGLMVLALGFVWRLDAERSRALAAETQARHEADTAQAVTRFLTELFAGIDPRVARDAELSARELLDRGAERLRTLDSGDPDIDARLRITVGALYTDIGLPEAAIAMLESATSLLEGVQSEASGQWQHELARALNQRQDWVRAEAVARQAVATKTPVHGEQAATVGHALQVLGVSLRGLDRIDEAERLFEQAEAIFRAAQPVDLEGLASARHNLAWMAQVRRDLPRARSLYEQAVEAKTGLYGERDPRTLNSISSLAQVLVAQGEYEAAAARLETVLAARRALHGEDSTETAFVLNEMASVQQDLGALARSQSLYLEALAILDRIAPASADAAISLNNYAFLLETRGDGVGAEARYRQSLGIREALFGPEHRNTIRVIHNLARVMLAQGKRAEAAALLPAVLAARAVDPGVDSPDHDDTRLLAEQASDAPNLAWIESRYRHYRAEGSAQAVRAARFGLALSERSVGSAARLEWLAESAEALRARFGAGHPLAAQLELRRVELLLAGGERESARARWVEVRALLLEQLAESSPLRARLATLDAELGPS
jgi:serine/threonine-protein kinase